MTVTVWHKGRARSFKDDEAADRWIKEIEMAKTEKRKAVPKDEVEVPAPPKKAEVEVEVVVVPSSCADCGVTFEGDMVTHPSRLGGGVTGRIGAGDNVAEWLEKVHAEEAA